MSVVANSLRTNTITAVREQAAEMGLFNPNEKVSFYDVMGLEDTETGSSSETATIKPTLWTLKLPKTANRQDLLDIKEFLLSKPRGNTQVELLLGTQRIDTKLTLSDTTLLEEWAKNRWGVL